MPFTLMKFHAFRRALAAPFLLWALLVVLALAASSARAQQLTGSLLSSSLPNYSGIAVEPAGTHALQASGFCTIVNSVNFQRTDTFSLRFRLVDSFGTQVSIKTETGTPGTEYRVLFNVTLGPQGRNDITQTAPLVPQQSLVAGAVYRVEARLFRETGGVTNYGMRTSIDYRFQIVPPTDPPGGAYQLRALVNSTQLLRSYAVASVPGQDTFRVRAQGVLGRFDHLAAAAASAAVSLHLDVILTGSTGNNVPLQNARTTIPASLANHTATGEPAGVTFDQTLSFKSAAQLDSTDTYTVSVRAAYTTPDAVETNGETLPLAGQRLLAFNGTVLFGNISSTLNAPIIVTNPGSPTPGGISTQIVVPDGGGTIDGLAGFSYGSPFLPVVLRADGVAVASGSVTPTGSGTLTLNGITFTRSGVTLGPGGANATVKVRLPTGFGYSSSKAVRTLDSSFTFTNAVLDASLLPVNSTWTPSGGGVLYACEESKPVWISVTGFEWQIAAGTIRPVTNGSAEYVRKTELDTLDANAATYSNPAAAVKRSNDGYFRFVSGVTANSALVRASANGAALLQLGLTFNAGSFRAHFPYNANVTITGGTAVIADDLFAPATSTLGISTPILTDYTIDCPGGCTQAGSTGTSTLAFQPAGAFRITPDGGLQGAGALTAATPLHWGYFADTSTVPFTPRYAHQALGMTTAEFFMPGNALAGALASSSLLVADERPGDLLLSGRGLGADANAVDRAGTAAYQAGAADYAGVNFRIGTNGARQGASRLAKVDFTYPLRGNGKYYVRQSGVSGVHEATPGSVGGNFALSGYPSTLNGLQFSFLDSLMERSLVTGSFHFGLPTNLDLDFENLKFTCLGALESLSLLPSNGRKHLNYWDADLTPLTLEFKRGAGSECNPNVGYAVMSVDANVSHVDKPCRGVIGLYPPDPVNGRSEFIPLDNLAGLPIDSRFALPSVIQLKGPPNQPAYTLTPITKAYYSQFSTQHQGFVTFAALLKVAFFEAVPVIVHTSGKFDPATTAPVYLMNARAVWNGEPGGGTFLTKKDFDRSNRGLPLNVTRSAFENDLAWQPKANKKWQDFLTFTNIPLKWSSSFRAFTSAEHGDVTLPIFPGSIKTTAAYLSSDIADLRFAKSFEISGLSLASMLYDATTEHTGFRDALDRAVGGLSAPLTSGLKSLDRLLKDDPTALLKPSLDAASANLANVLATTLAAPTVVGPTFLADSVTAANDAINNLLANNLRASLLSTAPGAVSVFKEVGDTLASARAAVGALRSIVAKNNGQRVIAASLAKQIVANLARSPALGDLAGALGGLGDQYFREEIARLDPSFTALDSVLAEIDGRLASLQTALPTNILTQLGTAISTTALGPVTTKTKELVATYINSFDINRSDRNPFAELNPAVLRAEIQRRIRDAFQGASIAGGIQTVLRERVGDSDAALRDATGSIFQQVNTVVRNGVSGLASSVSDSFSDLAGGAGGICAMGKIDGNAIIRGDALKRLRLDGRFKMQLGMEIGFTAFLEIKDIASTGATLGGCTPTPGTRRTEVTIGADEIPLDWALGSKCTASASARFTFDNGGLIGFGGMFHVTGGMKFQSVEISEAGFGLAIGAGEAYIAVAARGKLSGFEVAAGLFLGRSCDLKPLKLVDATIATADSLFGLDAYNAARYPFLGVYAHAEGWLPINEIFGIPDSCLLSLKAGAGFTFFLNLNDLQHPELGGAQLYGLEGRILCIATIRGELRMGGSARGSFNRLPEPSDLLLVGSVKFSGWVPDIEFLGEHIGIPFSLTLSARYEHGSFGLDTF